MKFTKTLILAYILPFIVVFNACQKDSEKQSVNLDQQSTENFRKDTPPPSTMNYESAPTSDADDITRSNEKKTDGTIKQINYQQPTENTNVQDKRIERNCRSKKENREDRRRKIQRAKTSPCFFR